MSSNYLTVYAPAHLDPTDSYGLIGCELVRHLSRLGQCVNAIALGNNLHPNQDEEVASLAARPLVAAKGGILLGYPTAYKDYGELANLSPKIALTMFESTKIPEGWVSVLNTMDAVITPSHFCRDIFIECGVTSPIFTFPLGISDVYRYRERDLSYPFTYLAFLDRGKRKGGLYALNAFVEEFGDDERVKLVLKSKPVAPKPQLEFQNGNIDTIYGDLTVGELNDLYGSCHCLINANKGEGFGLIPREFAATGGISLATNWGGTSEFIRIWGYPLDYEMEKADWLGIKNLQGKDLGEWAAPVETNIKSKMREVFEFRESFLKQARSKAIFTRNYYDWSFFAKCVLDLWNHINNGNS